MVFADFMTSLNHAIGCFAGSIAFIVVALAIIAKKAMGNDAVKVVVKEKAAGLAVNVLSSLLKK